MEGHTQSILDCVDDDGEVQLERLLQLQRSQMEEMEDLDEWMIALAEEEDAREREKQRSDARSVNTNRSKRSVKKRNTLLYRDTDGTVKPLTWDKSIWYLNYLENPRPADPKWNEKFRKRFRMAHESFIELGIIKLRQIIRPKYYIKMSFGRVVYGIGIGNPSPKFDRWKKKDAVGQRAAPTRLMLLGALRYIGRGWTFDDIEEATAIHESVRYRPHRDVLWPSGSG